MNAEIARRPILLVEDNPNDVELTQRAFAKANVANDLIVASDGVEALDYLFCRGAFAARDRSELPAVVLLDLKLPRLGGLEVLRGIRGNPSTRLLPVVLLTSSSQDQDKLSGTNMARTATSASPSTSLRSWKWPAPSASTGCS